MGDTETTEKFCLKWNEFETNLSLAFKVWNIIFQNDLIRCKTLKGGRGFQIIALAAKTFLKNKLVTKTKGTYTFRIYGRPVNCTI